MSLRIREATLADELFLREMLLQAIFVEEGERPPERSVLSDPLIARYVDGWGRDGDFGLIAEQNRNPVGAIWIRVFSESNRGFGWVDDSTPELSMAVEPRCRGQGIGTKLLHALLSRLSDWRQISLSVSPNNPVARLYRRSGFTQIGKSGTSVTMLRYLDEQ